MNAHIITPKLTICHPNCTGCGSVFQCEIRPAHGMTEGALFLRLVPQNPKYKTRPAFDWDNAVTFRLGFAEIGKMLQVFRGELESISDGQGLRLDTPRNTTYFRLCHEIYGIGGHGSYLIEVDQIDKSTNETRRCGFYLYSGEALGLCCAIEGAMKEIAFGTGFEATSIAIARDELVAEGPAEGSAASSEDKPLRQDKGDESGDGPDPDEDIEYWKKLAAKTKAIGMLCSYYGNEYKERIVTAVDIACGDYPADPSLRISEEDRVSGWPRWVKATSSGNT